MFPQLQKCGEHFNILSRFLFSSLPGIPITSFTQADLASRNIQYVHSSESENHSDTFSFTLSDGVHEVGEGLDSLSICRAT